VKAGFVRFDAENTIQIGAAPDIANRAKPIDLVLFLFLIGLS
jgi:hypothetical protein